MSQTNLNSPEIIDETLLSVKTSTVSKIDALIYAVAFVVPLVLTGPQLVVGTIVNACLFLAAENWPVKKLIPLAILPSVAAILHGVVLGGFTPFLLYMAPFIWLSNGILMLVYKLVKDKSLGLGVGLAAGLKALFLFSVAWILVNQHILPAPFLIAMGVLQLVTAIFGGATAQLTRVLIKKSYERIG